MTVSLSFDEFKKISENADVIPVFSTISTDLDTPVSIYLKLRAHQNKYSFLLESVVGGESLGRYSILGIESYAVLKGKENSFTFESLSDAEKTKVTAKDPIRALEENFLSYKPYQDSRLSGFYGGAVGFFSYDSVKYYENIVDENNKKKIDSQDAVFCYPSVLICFDHAMGLANIVCNVFLSKQSDVKKEYENAVEKISEIRKNIKDYKGIEEFEENKFNENEIPQDWRPNTSKEEYMKMVETAKEYIRAGDIFQVVLSKRFRLNYTKHPFWLYRSLRATNPSPYMFYLNFPESSIIGSSPEILVKKEDNKVTVRPIAGTIQRGKSKEEDETLGKKLLSDEKERAEHVMLVDLGRNDVGRIAEFGTVKISDIMVIEKYSHVMHIVSNVSGKISEEKNSFDALWAAFPAGTVSGAPKVRAMQIIEELEKENRGIYAGCIGYFSFDGNMDTAIALRTMWVKNNVLYAQAGAGIVYDSVPEKEDEEINKKAGAIFAAVDKLMNDKRK
ncbi:MAG: anthranilate synthase component I [Spirochaetia bacterium]|nr:anthranilate synthase component I [Spirochaetia bacterium]